MRERRIGRNHCIRAEACADDVGIPEIATHVGGRFGRREHHGDPPSQGQRGAGDQRPSGRPQAVRDPAQRYEVPNRREREQDEECDRAVLR